MGAGKSGKLVEKSSAISGRGSYVGLAPWAWFSFERFKNDNEALPLLARPHILKQKTQ